MQEQSQVLKKKKKTKKSKTEDSDSGVEVYFREEEDKEDEEKTQPESVKVSECTAAPHANLHRSGTAVSLCRARNIDFISCLSAGDTQLCRTVQTAGGSGFLLGCGTELPEACLRSTGGELQ